MRGGFAFAGVGGFELGFARAGITPAWQIENDPFASSILQKHWPDVRRYGDIREVDAHGLEPVDVIVGGFPCQDLSVAGKQRGLRGSRSSLFFEFVRIAATVRPEWLVLENVPGLLSACSCDGCRKCGALLRWHRRRALRDARARNEERAALCSCRGCATARKLRVAHRGTDMAVVASALANVGYGVAYRILDSRYFGVAQRRRRVFLVCHRGDRSARALLSDAGGSHGHPATRGASRAIAAGQLARSVSAVGGGNDPGANKGTIIVTEAVTSKWRKGSGGPSGDETQNLIVSGTIEASGTRQRAGGLVVAPALSRAHYRTTADDAEALIVSSTLQANSGRNHIEQDYIVASALRASDGHDSEDGTGRQPAFVIESRFARNGRGGPSSIVPPLKAQSGSTGKGDGSPLIVAATLTSSAAESKPGRRMSDDVNMVVYRKAKRAQTSEDDETWIEDDTTNTLNTFDVGDKRATELIADDTTVRRLTPTECERLQGFPDGWTHTCDVEPYSIMTCECPDGPRYQVMGNAVTVPVVATIARWIREA